MISFAKQIEAAVDQQMADAEAKAARRKTDNPASADHRARGGATRSEKTQAEYAKHFRDGNTVAKGAAAMGLSHVGCLNQIYRYERRGLMHRLAERDSENGGLIFVWGPHPEGNV